MQPIRHFNFDIFIAFVNIFVYFIVFLYIFTTFIFDFIAYPENLGLNSDQRYSFYLTLNKISLLIFSLIMIITSINLLRGIIKKSIALFNSWLLLSFCILVYQAHFLLDQVFFFLAYGYTPQTLLTLLGLSVIFALHTVCIRKILKFYFNLNRDNILQCEHISSVKNSALKSQNYLRNQTEYDSSLLAPLNEEELRKEYKNCKSVNLSQFEI